MSISRIDSSIKQLDAEIANLQKKISVLNERKETVEKMSQLLETWNLDEKQAMFELLQDMDNEGELGWAK